MMESMQLAWEIIKGLFNHWWFLPVCIVLTIGCWYGYWWLIVKREYKKINGRLCVRHGIGKWVDLEEHMNKHHPNEYANLKRKEKK